MPIPSYISDALVKYYERTGQTEQLAKQQSSIKAFKADLKTFDTRPASIATSSLANLRLFNFADVAPLLESPITIYDASTSPKTVFRTRTQVVKTTRDSEACFDSTSKTDAFCRKILKRHPVENTKSTEMKANLRDPLGYNRVYWDPKEEAIFVGDVDPKIFHSFAKDQDLISHEWGHAVVTYAGGLTYMDQSGALNESFADVFAITRKHYHRKNTNAADPTVSWLIAEKIFHNDNAKNAFRSMDAPGTAFDNKYLGKDPQPAHMNDYKNLWPWEDSGGVHTNSGIPNKAFHLAATKIGGPSWEKPLKIWFKALEISHKGVQFSQFAANTLKAAHQLYPNNGNVVNHVSKAWKEVGVDFKSGFTDLNSTLLKSVAAASSFLPAAFAGVCFEIIVRGVLGLPTKPEDISLTTPLITGIIGSCIAGELTESTVVNARLQSIGFTDKK